MTTEAQSVDKFFEKSDLTLEAATSKIQDGLTGTDYGEFYQEITARESISKDRGAYDHVSSGSGSSGFGFRVGQEERVGFVYSNEFNVSSLDKAIKQSRQILKGHSGTKNLSSGQSAGEMFPSGNPLAGFNMEEKIKKIDEIEAYTMSLDANIINVTIGYGAALKDVHIITADGKSLTEQRPMAQLSLVVTIQDANGKIEKGNSIIGGRVHCKDVFNDTAWQGGAKEALSLAKMRLIATEAPAGKMDVVLNHGWPAVVLHEAVGHGLEGDFNRKGSSVYSGKLDEKIASSAVTIIEQGNMPGERGSSGFDDEGTPTQKNILVEKGVLKKYMQDRQNAFLMNAELTGNGRRENYSSKPMPRMTNTYFAPGEHDPEEIIKSVKNGLYISSMGGGQIDITSGKFTMEAQLAYPIKNGKVLDEPVKGATITGKGQEIIKDINMVGNDLVIENSAGACGKNGQTVMVGIGQPTIRVPGMTVGGTG